MASSSRSPVPPGPWLSLWVVALVSLVGQLWICQFFSFGVRVPASIDVDPCNLWKFAYQFPPSGSYQVLNWLGVAYLPPPMNPFSLAALLPPWLFFTTYTPVMSTLALLALAGFLRELEISRPAALFGGVIFAWQGDLLPFVFPGHFGYIGTWVFFALAAWGALRSQRTGHWVYALIAGASCGLMVGLQPDRGGIASLLIAALYIAGALRRPGVWRGHPRLWTLVAALLLMAGLGELLDWSWLAAIAGLAALLLAADLLGLRHLVLCAAVALVISLAAFLALFQSFIVGVSMGGETNREETYKFDTQFSLGPEETLTYLVPGFFGWHSNHPQGPYWGRIGQWPDWPLRHEGMRNFNLAISTTGTVATALALLALVPLLPGPVGRWFGPGLLTPRQRFYGRLLLVVGAVGLVLAWGYHTPLYRLVFALPLMDKWRNPLKWLELTNFAAATLSAFGLQLLFASLSETVTAEIRRLRRGLLWFFYGLLSLLLLGLLLSYPLSSGLGIGLQANGYDADTIANAMHTLHTSLFVAVVLVGACCGLMHLLWRWERLGRWELENPWLLRLWRAMLTPAHLPLTLALALAGLSIIQLAWVAAQFVRPGDLAYLTATNPLVDALLSEGNTVRVSVDTQDPILNILLQNQFATPRISSLDISAASRVPDDLSAFFQVLGNDRQRLLFLAGVKNLVIPETAFADLQKDPDLAKNIDHVDGYLLEPTAAPNLPSHAIVHLRDYLNKATFIPSTEILPLSEQLNRLKDPKWDPRATVLLAEPGLWVNSRGASPSAEAFKAAQVNLTRYDSQQIDLTVQAPQAGCILINDAYDPDWQVQVNGENAPLLRADFLLRAIAVPPGESSVSLHYVAHYHVGNVSVPAETVNEFCDAAMLVSWGIAGVVLWQRRKTPLAAAAF
jgi:hypothetical protein